MINFLEDGLLLNGYSCKGTDLLPIFEMVKFFIVIIQVAVPFALVIWGSLDWFKALIAHDEKEMRMKRKPFVARVVAAIIILCLPWLVEFIAKELEGKNEFWTCYTEAKARIDFSNWQKNKSSNSGWDFGNPSASESAPETTTIIKNNCSEYNNESDCNKGSTSGTCKWTKIPGGDKGYCSKSESTLKQCSNYTLESACKTDDYGNTCEWYVADVVNNKKIYKCRINPDKITCGAYTVKGKDICNASKDSSGNACEWYEKGSASEQGCVTKK